MRKNITLIVLLLALSVATFFYISAHNQINALQKQFDEYDVGVNSRITLYESEDKTFFHLLSDDGKLFIGFTYGEHGIGESFWVNDDLSGKEFGFNFRVDRNRGPSSFFYKDNQYYTATNVLIPEYDQKVIEREEWIGGFETIYTLFPDGTTEINTEHKGYTPKLETWE